MTYHPNRLFRHDRSCRWLRLKKVIQEYCGRSVFQLAVLFTHVLAPPASAYTFVPPECTNGTKACIASGKLTYISVYGPIRAQDEEQFIEIDHLLPKDAPFPLVYVNSPGGKTGPAMEIGKILRRRNAEVRSGSPLFPDKPPECSSACTILAAGATRRYLTHVGLHSGVSRQPTGCGGWKKVPLSESTQKEITDYLRQMGMPPLLEETSLKTPADEMANFFLDPNQPIAGQMIATLGFFTGGPDDLKKVHDVVFTHGATSATRDEYLKNSAEEGLPEAVWEFVQYINAAGQGQAMAYATVCEFYGRKKPTSTGRSLGATWCTLAARSSKDSAVVKVADEIRDELTRGFSSEDLQKVQDRATKWRPTETPPHEACVTGAGRL